MGFSAGLYTYPRFHFMALTKNTRKYIECYLDYEQSKEDSWYRKNYPSADEYAKARLIDDGDIGIKNEDKRVEIDATSATTSSSISSTTPEITFLTPSKEMIDFYRDRLIYDTYDKTHTNGHIYKELTYWCSNGTIIYDYFHGVIQDRQYQIKTNPTCMYDGSTIEEGQGYIHFELTQEDVINFADFCWKQIEKMSPKPGYISKSFKYLPKLESDGEGSRAGRGFIDDNQPEYEDIRYYNCDGIIVHFEPENCDLDTFECGLCAYNNGKGVEKKFEGGIDSEVPIGIVPDYFDEYTYNSYVNGLNTALQILKDVNFMTEVVYYSGGY